MERIEDENWQRDQMAIKWRGKEESKTENAMEGLR